MTVDEARKLYSEACKARAEVNKVLSYAASGTRQNLEATLELVKMIRSFSCADASDLHKWEALQNHVEYALKAGGWS